MSIFSGCYHPDNGGRGRDRAASFPDLVAHEIVLRVIVGCHPDLAMRFKEAKNVAVSMGSKRELWQKADAEVLLAIQKQLRRLKSDPVRWRQQSKNAKDHEVAKIKDICNLAHSYKWRHTDGVSLVAPEPLGVNRGVSLESQQPTSEDSLASEDPLEKALATFGTLASRHGGIRGAKCVL